MTISFFLFFLFLSYILHCKIADEVIKSEEFIKPITSSPLLTDDIIIEIKVMNERCILLTDEIQQLKREVSELSQVTFHCYLERCNFDNIIIIIYNHFSFNLQKPELTEEDMLMIKEKQDVLMSKVSELEQLTQKFQKVLQKDLKDVFNIILFKLFYIRLHFSNKFNIKFCNNI